MALVLATKGECLCGRRKRGVKVCWKVPDGKDRACLWTACWEEYWSARVEGLNGKWRHLHNMGLHRVIARFYFRRPERAITMAATDGIQHFKQHKYLLNFLLFVPII